MALFSVIFIGSIAAVATGVFIWEIQTCHHNKIGRPFPAETSDEKEKFGQYGYYTFCKVCRKQIPFDWGNNHQVRQITREVDEWRIKY